MNSVRAETLTANEYPLTVRVRGHEFRADLQASSGSTDSAPGPHDFFDAALATCKAMTALWYAKRNNIPLERVESVVDSDNSDEKKGVYKLRVKLTFHGPLSDEQRARLGRAVSACPIHKLMTTSEVLIETAE
jgi:putative redox protein